MELPLILVNFKCYREATGKKALKLAKACESVGRKFGINFAVVPQFTDLVIAKKLKIKVFAQGMDVEEGAFTGHISALALKEARVAGVLLNHSENRLKFKKIGMCIKIARKYGLTSVVCSKSIAESKKIVKFRPDFVAYEEPSLIGTGRAISRIKPKVVKRFVKAVKGFTIPICGAGISTELDVKLALELGTKGVIISSAVVKSDNPKALLEKIAKVIKI